MFDFWMRIELAVYTSIGIANTIFLIARSITISVLELDSAASTKNEQTDYLEANIIKMGTIEAFFSPAIVSMFIFYTSLVTRFSQVDANASWLGQLFMFFQIIQTLSTFFLNFVSCYEY